VTGRKKKKKKEGKDGAVSKSLRWKLIDVGGEKGTEGGGKREGALFDPSAFLLHRRTSSRKRKEKGGKGGKGRFQSLSASLRHLQLAREKKEGGGRKGKGRSPGLPILMATICSPIPILERGRRRRRRGKG